MCIVLKKSLVPRQLQSFLCGPRWTRLRSILNLYLSFGGQAQTFLYLKQKTSRCYPEVFQWAQMDSNHRPSDYESAGFITSLSLISAFSGFRYILGTALIGGCSNVFNQRQEITILSNRLFC